MPLPDSKHRLTVVQILPALESGGVERGTLEVGKYLVEQGHRSIVISAGGRLVEQLQGEGSEHFTWEVGRKSPYTLLRYVGRLRRFLRDENVDILHVRSRMPAWVGYLAWRGMDPKRRPRFVTTVHGLYSVNNYSAVMVKGERVIAVSSTVLNYIRNNYPKVAPGSIVVINRGVDPAEFSPDFRPSTAWLADWRREYPDLQSGRILLLPGRITRLKGHEDFLRLIADLRSCGLPVRGLIVGGAAPGKQAYLDELRHLTHNLGLDAAITFTGQRGDLREIMAVSDIVLSLSSKPESFGRTVLEAYSLGIPVIGYAHGGVGEQLEALLPEGCIAPGDLLALADRIKQWLDTPPRMTKQHAFTLNNMLQGTLALYAQLANKPESE